MAKWIQTEREQVELGLVFVRECYWKDQDGKLTFLPHLCGYEHVDCEQLCALMAEYHLWRTLESGQARESEVEELRQALQLAVEDLWEVKNALMDMRDATDLEPVREKWIAAKMQFLRAAALSSSEAGDRNGT